MPSSTRRSWLPPAAALAATFAVMAVAAGLGIALTNAADGTPTIWFTGGILLAILLNAPRGYWPALLATGLGATAAMQLGCGGSLPRTLSMTVGAAAGLILAAIILRRERACAPDLTKPVNLLEFAVVALLVAPAASSMVSAASMSGLTDVPFPVAFGLWYPASALGLAIMTPLGLSIMRHELLPLFRGPGAGHRISLLLAYGVLLVAVFDLSRLPLLFLPLPLLLMLVARVGFPGTGLAILLTVIVALAATLHGHGPFLLPLGYSLRERIFFLQVFTGVIAGTAYPFAAIVAERRRIIRELFAQHARTCESERQYRLLADNSSDIIACIGVDGVRRYVSPAVQEVLGWSVAEMMVPDWSHIIHPDDLPGAVAARESLRGGRPRVTNTARFRRRDGTWCWLEARMHLVRDAAGRPDEMLLNLRDVTRQKAAEARLDILMAKLAAQAATDPLTGIANRRRFEEAFEREWAAAIRDQAPISILMIDADRFKAFNDRYGHQAGDDCLRAIAGCLAAQTRQPVDVVARYGGEEFAVILPRTSGMDARQIGLRIRAAVEALDYAHADNAAGNGMGVVTVSIGAATMEPARGEDRRSLVEAADSALYDAKRSGRNRVQAADGEFGLRGRALLRAVPRRALSRAAR